MSVSCVDSQHAQWQQLFFDYRMQRYMSMCVSVSSTHTHNLVSNKACVVTSTCTRVVHI